MESKNSRFQASNDIQGRLDLINELEEGRLEEIKCPKCGKRTVVVRFTQPTPDEYRTWFICELCDFEMRVQNSEKPKYFGEGRFDPRLQGRDEQITDQTRLP